MSIDIKKMRIFVAIVEDGSFTSAAEKLNMAQPWVSVQLRQLEESLAIELIDRAKGKVVGLTPVGRQYYDIAKALLASCEQASRKIDDLRAQGQETLTLGVDPITLYIPERNLLIKQFMENASDIDLKIVSRSPAELFVGLEDGHLDLILTSTPTPGPAVEFMSLYEYDLGLAVPRERAREYEAARLGNFDGARLLTLPYSYHPAMFDRLRRSLATDRICWVTCPEASLPALIRYASMMGIAALMPDFSDSIPEMRTELDLRTLPNANLRVQWGLMRNAEPKRRSGERFWQMAQQTLLRARAA